MNAELSWVALGCGRLYEHELAYVRGVQGVSKPVPVLADSMYFYPWSWAGQAVAPRCRRRTMPESMRLHFPEDIPVLPMASVCVLGVVVAKVQVQ